MNRSQPATLFLRPVTADGLIHDSHNNTKSSEYSKYTRSGMITSTGHDRLLYNPDRSLPTTLYAFYPVGSSPSEYTENTRLCIMTSTGHDRLLYNPNRSLPTTLYMFHTRIGAPVDRRRYLILRPRPCFVHRPDYSSVFTYGLGLT